MTTAFIKKIFQHGGIDLKSFDKAQFEYSRLYGKYRDYTMIPRNLFILNLDLCFPTAGYFTGLMNTPARRSCSPMSKIVASFRIMMGMTWD